MQYFRMALGVAKKKKYGAIEQLLKSQRPPHMNKKRGRSAKSPAKETQAQRKQRKAEL
jgi:hypothetical protein